MIEREYFKVVSETKDFVVIKMNLEAEFNGKKLNEVTVTEVLPFWQYLLDVHGLVTCIGASRYDLNTQFICHKVHKDA